MVTFVKQFDKSEEMTYVDGKTVNTGRFHAYVADSEARQVLSTNRLATLAQQITNKIRLYSGAGADTKMVNTGGRSHRRI